MLKIFIDLFIFIVLVSIFCIGFAIVWSFCIDKKYWNYRKKLHTKKIKKLEEKVKKLKSSSLYEID